MVSSYRITVVDNSTACLPRLMYYRSVLQLQQGGYECMSMAVFEAGRTSLRLLLWVRNVVGSEGRFSGALQ